MTIPHFIHNLSSDTFEAMENRQQLPHGYLLAPNNASRELVSYLPTLRRKRRTFFADNGNFVEIGIVRKRFRQRAKNLKSEVKAFEDNVLARSTRPGELPLMLQNKYRQLARDVAEACKGAHTDDAFMLQQQLQLRPTAIIGQEDITMATWLGLDIEPAYTHFRRRKYRAMNRRVAAKAREILNSLSPSRQAHYFPVASAMCYNSAFDAGREFARQGIQSVSMGFGSYMADANFVDYALVGRRRVDFGANLPARYIRTVMAAKGFWAGYQHVAGIPPKQFHFLGLGAPIMLPLIALVANDTPKITFDAVSPIKDATKDGVLYVDKPAPLKIRIRKAALRLSLDESAKWECPCPFCTQFTRQHPFNYSLGRQWQLTTGKTKVSVNDLKPSGDLFQAYPLFSEPTGGTNLRQQVNYARIGHNHWITNRLLKSVRRASREERLPTRVSNIVSSYQKHTSPPFAKALGLSLELALQ